MVKKRPPKKPMASPKREEERLYRVPIGPFSLEATAKWTLSSVIFSGPKDEDGGAAAGMLTTKAVQSFQRNMIVTMEVVDPTETPEGYVKRQSDGLRQANVGWQELVAPQRVKTSGGSDGVISEQIILGAGGERVRQMQLVFIEDFGGQKLAYTAIASHLDGRTFERVRSEFRDMLLSIELVSQTWSKMRAEAEKQAAQLAAAAEDSADSEDEPS
jgi:hypothetical protein